MTAVQHRQVRLPRALRRTVVTALAVTLLGGAAATPAVAAAPAGPADGQQFQQVIQAIADSGITGIQLRVDNQNGDWVGSAGSRTLGGTAKPPTDGRFRIGSITKTFTATVVLQLVGEGRIGLDSPAADYLPEFGLDPRITVRMLLQHTSGLFNFTGEYYPDGTVVPGIPWSGKEWVDNRFHTYQPADLVRFALSKPPRFAPGTDWSYSNTNYVVLRLLIEHVTGQSYAQEIQQRILRPLGLRDTVVPGDRTDIPGPHAHGYYRYQENGQWQTVDITRQNPSWISSAGEMISTTRDLNTFFSALLGGKLLPAPLLTQMRTPNPKYGYGLGLFIQDGSTPTPFPPPSCGAHVITHDGGVQGYGTMLYSTPDGHTTFSASLTYVDDANETLAPQFEKAIQSLVNVVFCGSPTGSA